jgi:hypothetical protein
MPRCKFHAHRGTCWRYIGTYSIWLCAPAMSTVQQAPLLSTAASRDPQGIHGAALSPPQDTDHTVSSIQQRRGTRGRCSSLPFGLLPPSTDTRGSRTPSITDVWESKPSMPEEQQPPHPPARNEASAFLCPPAVDRGRRAVASGSLPLVPCVRAGV